jgi:hypothetical protein
MAGIGRLWLAGGLFGLVLTSREILATMLTAGDFREASQRADLFCPNVPQSGSQT